MANDDFNEANLRAGKNPAFIFGRRIRGVVLPAAKCSRWEWDSITIYLPCGSRSIGRDIRLPAGWITTVMTGSQIGGC